MCIVIMLSSIIIIFVYVRPHLYRGENTINRFIINKKCYLVLSKDNLIAAVQEYNYGAIVGECGI